MTIRITTKHLLTLANIVSWVIFAGLCIQAGAIIVHTVTTLTMPPEQAAKFWKEINLTALYNYDQSQFITLASIIIIVTVLKAIMFYCIVKIFYSKKLTLSKPFDEVVRRLVSGIAFLALGIGLFSLWGEKLAGKLVARGVALPELQQLKLGGADVWILMSVTLFVVALILKKGIEIQNENDLTI